MDPLSPRICCVSVDVDGIEHYQAIHGLNPANSGSSGLAHTLGVERLCQWAESLGVPLTWFVIARDTDNEAFVRLIRAALNRGHELASHSLDHRYDLVRLPVEVQRVQVVQAQEILERKCGRCPVGFRAPGYTVSDSLLDILERAGLKYDSSVFPCPAYYGAKALVLLAQKLQGRRSHSILDNPRVLGSPTQPYRRGRPYTRRGSGIIEFPIQVTPAVRLPFIGTTLTLGGPDWARRLARSLLGVRLVNLELHAIDVLSADDGLSELARYQKDLRVPVSRKLSSLSAAIEVFKTAGYRFVTLADAAHELHL